MDSEKSGVDSEKSGLDSEKSGVDSEKSGVDSEKSEGLFTIFVAILRPLVFFTVLASILAPFWPHFGDFSTPKRIKRITEKQM